MPERKRIGWAFQSQDSPDFMALRIDWAIESLFCAWVGEDLEEDEVADGEEEDEERMKAAEGEAVVLWGSEAVANGKDFGKYGISDTRESGKGVERNKMKKQTNLIIRTTSDTHHFRRGKVSVAVLVSVSAPSDSTPKIHCIDILYFRYILKLLEGHAKLMRVIPNFLRGYGPQSQD
jgi:RNase P protein component